MPVRNPQLGSIGQTPVNTAPDASQTGARIGQAAVGIVDILNARADKKTIDTTIRKLQTEEQKQQARITQGIRGATKDVDLLTEEQENDPLLRSAVNRYRTLTNARIQGKIGDRDFRIEAEKILQDAKAEAPHLTSELHQAARQTLGFDPTGTATELATSKLEAEAEMQQAILDTQFAIAEQYGVDFNLLGTPEGQVEFFDQVNLYRTSALILGNIQQQNAIREAQGDRSAASETRDWQSIKGKAVESFMQHAKGGVNFIVNKFKNMSPGELASAESQSAMAQEIFKLEELKSQIKVEMAQQYPATSGAVIEDIDPVFKFIDAVADDLRTGSFTTDRYEAAWSIMNNATKLEPRVFKLIQAGELYKNFEAFPELRNLLLRRNFADDISKLTIDAMQALDDMTAPGEFNPGELSFGDDEVTRHFSSSPQQAEGQVATVFDVLNMTEAEPAQGGLFYAAQKAIEKIAGKQQDRISEPVVNRMFSYMASDKYDEMIESLPPEYRDQVDAQALKSLANTEARVRVRFSQQWAHADNKLGGKIDDLVSLDMTALDNGIVQFVPLEENNRFAQDVVHDLNRRFSTSFSNYIKIQKKFNGLTPMETLQGIGVQFIEEDSSATVP